MHHGPAGASVTSEEWMDVYRPAIYRQIANARRVLADPKNPTRHQRVAMHELYDLVEELLGLTERVDESAAQRIRREMLAQQARLLRL